MICRFGLVESPEPLIDLSHPASGNGRLVQPSLVIAIRLGKPIVEPENPLEQGGVLGTHSGRSGGRARQGAVCGIFERRRRRGPADLIEDRLERIRGKPQIRLRLLAQMCFPFQHSRSVMVAKRSPTRDRQQQNQGQRARGSRRRIAPAPAPAVLDEAGPPRPDRPIVEESLDVFRQVSGRLVAPFRLPGDRFEDDGLKVARDRPVQALRPRRCVVQDLTQQLAPVGGVEGRAQGQQFVESQAQAVNVTAPVRNAVELLRGHITKGPNHVSGPGQVLLLGQLGQAEVRHPYGSRPSQNEVARLDIAMQGSLSMRVMNGRRRLHPDRGYIPPVTPSQCGYVRSLLCDRSAPCRFRTDVFRSVLPCVVAVDRVRDVRPGRRKLDLP